MSTPCPVFSMETLIFVSSYFLGSIPFGLIISKYIYGVDPRKIGSGNIGATNVTRAAGKFAGIITLILDALKGTLAVIVASKLSIYPWAKIVAGGFAIVGHCLSPFLNFKGGKGVATGAGVFAAVDPVSFAMSLCIFILVFLYRRIVSLASISAAVSMPIFMLINKRSHLEVTITALISIFIIIRHTDNIKRLLKNEEKPLF